MKKKFKIIPIFYTIILIAVYTIGFYEFGATNWGETVNMYNLQNGFSFPIAIFGGFITSVSFNFILFFAFLFWDTYKELMSK